MDATLFNQQLVSIGGLTDAGLPHLRVAWGQSLDGLLASTYLMDGGVHLKHRHHVKKTPLLAFPIYGVDNKIVDYDIYAQGDVLPVGRVAGALLMKEDIGIPRFFIEQAWAIDPEEWGFQRYLTVMRHEPDPGPSPEGGLVYEEMYCLAVHKACCNADGLTPQNRRCYGEYRAPSEIDLQVLRKTEERMRAADGWNANEGWRNPAVSEQVAKAVRQHHIEDALREEKEEIEREYLIASQLKPHSRRLSDEGSGMDFQKYKFVPSNYRRRKRRKHASNANV